MMNLKELKEKPLWQMTGEEFLQLQSNEEKKLLVNTPKERSKKYVYGIVGIAQIFGCSIATANRIKKTGKIKEAITQIGRKIIVDAELALELAGKKSIGRR